MEHLIIAGLDEAGRGPLAGPVIAAAVILDPHHPIEGLKDSKQLTPHKRDILFDQIMTHALCTGIGRAEVEEIDQLNILNASLLAMERAFMELSVKPDHALVDGNKTPTLPCPAEAIIKGDQKIAAISAASILAKVTRDREMEELGNKYPVYGFAIHKGYPTKAHREAVKQYGRSPVHRRSFRC